MKQNKIVTKLLAVAVGVVMVGSLAACATSTQSDGNGAENDGNSAPNDGATVDAGTWPDEALEFVIPTAAGGGLDTTFRQLQPFLEAELGQPIAVQYRAGGQFAIGTTYVAQNGANCEPFMFHAIPDVVFSYLTRDVEYTYDDFYPIAGMTTEPSTLWVANDAPWATIQELVDYAATRPGEVRISVSNLTSADHLAALRLEEQTGVDFNIVSYDGGGPARNAVVSGEVEAAMGGVFASQGIADRARALTVFQDSNIWGDLTDNAPAVNDALGTDIPNIGGRYGIFVTRECKEVYPERFEILSSAVSAAMNSEGFLAALTKIGQQDKVSYLGPDEFHAFIEGEIEAIKAQIEQSPELFGVSG